MDGGHHRFCPEVSHHRSEVPGGGPAQNHPCGEIKGSSTVIFLCWEWGSVLLKYCLKMGRGFFLFLRLPEQSRKTIAGVT